MRGQTGECDALGVPLRPGQGCEPADDGLQLVMRGGAVDAHGHTGDEALVTDQKPTWCSAPDCYVFPRNLAWTMAFTHEDGWLGPFFARHPDFERLQGDNLKGLRKAQRAAAARQRGWS